MVYHTASLCWVGYKYLLANLCLVEQWGLKDLCSRYTAEVPAPELEPVSMRTPSWFPYGVQIGGTASPICLGEVHGGRGFGVIIDLFMHQPVIQRNLPRGWVLHSSLQLWQNILLHTHRLTERWLWGICGNKESCPQVCGYLCVKPVGCISEEAAHSPPALHPSLCPRTDAKPFCLVL